MGNRRCPVAPRTRIPLRRTQIPPRNQRQRRHHRHPRRSHRMQKRQNLQTRRMDRRNHRRNRKRLSQRGSPLHQTNWQNRPKHGILGNDSRTRRKTIKGSRVWRPILRTTSMSNEREARNSWIVNMLSEWASGLTDTDYSWLGQQACKGLDPNLFFAERGAGAAATVRDAKAVCNKCPVQQRCLEWAVNNNQIYGIWGGKTADERRRTKLFRNRPPSPVKIQMVKELRKLKEDNHPTPYAAIATNYGTSSASVHRAENTIVNWEEAHKGKPE